MKAKTNILLTCIHFQIGGIVVMESNIDIIYVNVKH